MVYKSKGSIVLYRTNNNYIVNLLLAFLLFGMLAGTANAFYFRGYTYNETNVTLNNTIVSIEVYSNVPGQGPTLVNTNYTSSDAAGNFIVWVNGSWDSQQYMYKPVLKHFENDATAGTLDWIGQSLPQFPRGMIRDLTEVSPMNFYLRKGGTIYLNASGLNQSQIEVPFAFKYVIKDTRMGYPVADNFAVEQFTVGPIHVPLERNYSIMIIPNQSLPVSYDLNNLSNYPNNTANLTFNTSIRPLWVSGYANLSDGTSNFTDFKIIPYLMEPGNMIGKDRPMPFNMSGFRPPSGPMAGIDIYDLSTGYYNITLPGSAQGAGANILLFATAYNSSTSEYYGAFKNVTMSYYGYDQVVNFRLYPLLGREENISVNDMGLFGQPRNITTKMLPFKLINESSSTNITNSSAHIEIQVDYSANGSSSFKWMVDVSQTDQGSFSLPAINANISKINVFMQDFAPKKTSKNTSQLANWPVNITMNSFENKKPGGNGGQLSGIKMDMLISKTECDRPDPQSGCSLLRGHDGQDQNQSEFNPFKVVLGGGKISMRIKQRSTNITVHYVNVDMLASGPPDALFDENKTQSQSGSTLEQAWRFGSNGPEIYDYVLIGMPIDSSLNASNLTIKLGGLYDENWNEQWNMSAGGTINNLPSEYNEFNETLFNSTGIPCSTVDLSGGCYVNLTNRKVWLRIPHFSGFRSTISSEVVSGNITVNLSQSEGTIGSIVNMNFTVRDTQNATSWFNFTFPNGYFNIAGAIIHYIINGVTEGWTNYTDNTNYINITGGGTVAYSGNTSYINFSNITLIGGPTSTFITVRTNNSGNINVTYNVSSSGPAIIPQLTIYDSLSGGFANEVMPNFTLNVLVINTSNGVNVSNVWADISEVNTTIGNIRMVHNYTDGLNYYFNLTTSVNRTVRGTFNATVTAYDNSSNSNTTNLSIEAHMYPGLNVIGWNSSKARPAYPTNVSLFYNNSPVIIIVNTTDDTHYSNITIDFSGVDGNSTLVFNNSGVLMPDGRNYTYTLRHTLGDIPIDDVTIALLNATLSIQGVDVIIPQMGALVVVSNINPRDMPIYDLSGATTDWKLIPDYSAASLTFEKVTIGGANATLRFNVPINLTDSVTAQSLRTLGDNLMIAERSVNLTAAENALREFNKSANIMVSNLTAFTTSPAIFQDGTLIALPDQTLGGAASNISWDQSSHTLTLNVSHWTNYSWGTYGVNLTNVSVLTGSSVAGTNVTYIFTLQNNGTLGDSYNLTISNPIPASTAALNISGNITLEPNEVRMLSLNVSHGSAGTFPVNVTARSNNDSNKFGYINTTTTIPIVINITNPANASTNTTGYVNVTVTLDNAGLARFLNWDGVNYSMNPNTSSSAGTVFYYNKSGLLSGNYSFKIYANDTTGVSNASETITVIVNLTNTTNLSSHIDQSTGNLSEDVIMISPSGNVTVTISNGTNATVNGTTITNITIDSRRTLPYALTDSNDRFIGENLTLGPDGAVFAPAIRLNFSYNDSQLGTIPASRLKIKFYNNDMFRWDELTTTVNTNSRIATATTSHFSTFALTGSPTPSSTSSSSSSGGGSSGGGGGGGVSGENFSNIIVKEKYELYIFKDKVTHYAFKNASSPVMFVNITGNVNAGSINTALELLKARSSLVNATAPGVVYKNFNVWVGTSGFVSPKNIKEAVIGFRVLNSWLTENGISATDIQLVRWDGTKWVQLETAQNSKDSTYTYFEAKTTAFANFAIVGSKGEIVPTATPESQASEQVTGVEETPIESKKKGTPGFEFVLSGVVLSMLYLFVRTR